MDTLAHALWTYIIFHSTQSVWLAVFFGMMPDLFSWTVWMLWPRKGKFTWKKPDLTLIPDWVFTLYGATHSIFSMTVVFLATYIALGSIPIYLWAWPIHVLIDIPTHRRDFLPTPFLWPISDWRFPGISWANRYFMIPNYLCLTVAFILISL